MKLDRKYTAKEISDILSLPAFGDLNVEIYGINEIHRVEKGDIAFVDHPKYFKKVLSSDAVLILINQKIDIPAGKVIMLSEDPFGDFNRLLKYFSSLRYLSDTDAQDTVIGQDTVIHPSAVIGKNVRIGKNCKIMANVSICDDTAIGNNVVIQAGSVIGADGFYFKSRSTYFEELHSVGRVVIEDDVHIGSNCTIDKGVTSDTRIGKGTKIDNLVQIGHDTIIGGKCLVASQTGISGCVTIGDNVVIWGQTGITSGVVIGDHAVISAQSGVSKNLEGNKKYAGSPAIDFQQKYREKASLRMLPDLVKMVKRINGYPVDVFEI